MRITTKRKKVVRCFGQNSPPSLKTSSMELNPNFESVTDQEVAEPTLKLQYLVKEHISIDFGIKKLTKSVLFSELVDLMKKEKTHPTEEEIKGKKKVLRIDLEIERKTGICAGTNENSCTESCPKPLTESLSKSTWNVGAIRYHDFKTNTSSLINLSPRRAHGSNGKTRSIGEDSGLSKKLTDPSLPKSNCHCCVSIRK